ncbi:MAG: mechanosensitive ion channel protein [Methylophaga sp.]|nr:MAG: mechanosensitive ion channel protein [Methylophaga sp.]
MNLESIKVEFFQLVDTLAKWAVSPKFYAQIIAIALAIFLAWTLAKILKRKVSFLHTPPVDSKSKLAHLLLGSMYTARDLVFPILALVFLSIAIQVTHTQFGQSWLIIIAQGLGVVFLLRTAITRFIHNGFIRSLFLWVGIPIATLHVFGWLDDTVLFLDGMALEIGNIRLSAYALARVAIFGSILFWLGRLSNKAGQEAIRSRKTLDIRSREVFSKLFEIALFMVIFFVLLQIVGINLTTLAVFGGALGVGLGFGLQQIAANFISGIIILLDGSMTVGEYIELEDGRSGHLIAINMRSSTIETYEGKEIVVPNEQFITTAFTNWTRKDPYQRYTVEFSVSYDSDIPAIPALILEAVRKHPQILETPEPPDCEITGFGDSGVNFHVEYWIEGIDDGRNRVDSDLMIIIWNTLKENNISMPFPQREVRIIGGELPK